MTYGKKSPAYNPKKVSMRERIRRLTRDLEKSDEHNTQLLLAIAVHCGAKDGDGDNADEALWSVALKPTQLDEPSESSPAES